MFYMQSMMAKNLTFYNGGILLYAQNDTEEGLLFDFLINFFCDGFTYCIGRTSIGHEVRIVIWNQLKNLNRPTRRKRK